MAAALISLKAPRLNRSYRSSRPCGPRCAKHLIERLQDFARRLARDQIVDRLCIAPRGHQAILAKERKMLGDRGVAQGQELGEIADRTLPVDELADDEKPVPVGERLQQLAR